MDNASSRLQIAQELVQALVNALSLQTPPGRAAIQQVLDNAAAKLKVLDSQPVVPEVPLVVPSLIPKTP